MNRNIQGHLCMAIAAACWGLMAPLGKDAMAHGISGFDMVGIRVTGGALCFWLASLFVKYAKGKKTENNNNTAENEDKITKKEYLRLFGAALFAIVFNQCNYIVGLSITSPLNASIMTTTMPIITMVLAAIIIREPITWKKLGGVILGASGAATLILASAGGVKEGGVLLGDLMCIGGQLSYAIYLTAFKDVISRHSAITCQKWMMTFAALAVLPFALPSLIEVPWQELSATTYAETAFVVLGGTFLSFLCCTTAQQILRPTVIAMYNYMQPIVACIVSVMIGIGVFGWSHAIAAGLVFLGVYLVNASKAKASERIADSKVES